MAKKLKSRFNFSPDPLKSAIVVDKRYGISKKPKIISASIPLSESGKKRLFIGTGIKNDCEEVLIAQVKSEDRVPHRSIFTDKKNSGILWWGMSFFYLATIFLLSMASLISFKFDNMFAIVLGAIFGLALILTFLSMRSVINHMDILPYLWASNPYGLKPRKIETSSIYDNYSYRIARVNSVVDLSGLDISDLVELGQVIEEYGDVKEALDAVIRNKTDFDIKSDIYRKLSETETELKEKLELCESRLNQSSDQLLKNMSWLNLTEDGNIIRKGLNV